jgi:ribosomal protein L37AE/L43A
MDEGANGSETKGPPRFASVAMDEKGELYTCCEACGSRNLDYDGADIDKCRDCGHWRYR